MEIDLLHLWAQMGIAAKLVVISLSVMAIITIAVTIDRLVAISRWHREAAKYAPRAAEAVRGHQYAAFVAEVGDNKHPLPRLLRAGLKSYLDGIKQPSHEITAVEFARRELARVAEMIGADCRRGMNALASIASVAPFVGLFGTVVGIIAAFEGIAKTGSGGLGAVSAGIAEALIVTGIGLGVAIPAVLLFNFLSAKIDRFELSLQTASGELIDQLEKNHGHDRERVAA
ncbi:MotA/TolQ/ExbB proton channel family protein [Vulgatibacter sp.]|uniref:MotA/TolQ/ExbB proton channel family protein n=1 Tax=Vulgatibacter sp. TaxID=1971226 RepID=UPI003561C207